MKVKKKVRMVYVMFFFFKQKTAYEIKECDWSSDVCSSDLIKPTEEKTITLPLSQFARLWDNGLDVGSSRTERDRKSVV